MNQTLTTLISVTCLHKALIERAKHFAEQYGYVVTPLGKPSSAPYEICFSLDGIYLQRNDGKSKTQIRVDFIAGSMGHRRKFGGGKGQDIAKAVGLNKGVKPSVMDMTAGMGKDAFVLASLGCHVQLCERSPIVHLLLQDGLLRAKQHAEIREEESELMSILRRMELTEIDSLNMDSSEEDCIEVVYLDPMFPERSKSALVKKEMQVFHDIVGKDEDADGLLPLALHLAEYRVVVKRPKIAPYLNNQEPSFQFVGKSSRFDVYALKAFK
ncbi:class I SAM-dependent methyltransferase [Teredinibacter sp. KSP-S5-2]|uniref:class I SAM-dependent methyltransferase n=1 Tax=Teredinibacter sp. KSP-S5-2 TaxID=3034506 RepID=UPI0029345618|nr:class I SAM-dependent methyltransferase [Teredinibacter sp. KSP-S5-2]WNO09814.1 class I SAM-dependent methyltransferase [Teredinibacter sp. KSP-S5-2]